MKSSDMDLVKIEWLDAMSDDNTWQDINPWHKYFNNGLYELDKLKNWRGKFMACQRNHSEFLLNNIKPNGRKKRFSFLYLF